ncbi:hypothetical protein H9L15_08105 [Sphingomonas daechungensis]|uniref:Uncharacterized protein n=1 Tax=Sphingomonas daechungensis TaxID=1176646 RepID=A0ABX6SYC9_9SPHN|nr:hypothetical protein [Sphingomonas daechungensis]QNP42309.1 hypothetical protein H9L15_08105 [Sphingomonas daechungensis]
MKLLVALSLLLAASPAQATGLTVKMGETWLFTLKNGEPANARKVPASATIPKGQIKVAVRAMLGTGMTITNNSPIAYTFRAELISGGKATLARSCTLPSKARPAFEQWPQKADAIRIGAFKVADEDGHC